MTRRQWTGLAGVLFALAMFIGILVSGTTPDTDGSGAVQRYTDHWADGDNQDKASLGSILLTYACVLLVLFASGLRGLIGGGPLSRVVLTAGAASAALLGAGSALINGAGIAGAESSGYQVDGNDAMLVEAIGYYTVTASMMLAATMAVAFALVNRRDRVVPQWTIVLAGLLGLVGLGSIFLAWIGFLLLPLWSLVLGLTLLVTRGADTEPATG